MEDNLAKLAIAETWDNGKPLRETMAADIPLAIGHFRYFAVCLRAVKGGISEIDHDTVAYHFHEPLGGGGQIIVIACVRDSGPLDVLVINSGFAIFGDSLEQDPDEIDRLFRVNVHAPYHASVEAARTMPDGGRIIVIGSVNGDRMPLPGMASYALSKSALQGLARGLARDFGPRGITINIVQPGPIDTDANPAEGPMKDLMHGFMAIKRHGRPEEVAGIVAWLAGPEAGFVTGAMHTIDGAFGA